ncbi:MAG: hypothetical protein NWF13_02595 [Candidatus Bathyarchaeota archaeon]|nr:hypothetical protein [Candidatus Bathyarchaeota archaeon]
MADNVSYLKALRDEAKVVDEINIQEPLSSRTCNLFQVFFLMNDEDQSVLVCETSEIDLDEVIGCLKQGDSVFITCKEGLVEV